MKTDPVFKEGSKAREGERRKPGWAEKNRGGVGIKGKTNSITIDTGPAHGSALRTLGGVGRTRYNTHITKREGPKGRVNVS